MRKYTFYYNGYELFFHVPLHFFKLNYIHTEIVTEERVWPYVTMYKIKYWNKIVFTFHNFEICQYFEWQNREWIWAVAIFPKKVWAKMAWLDYWSADILEIKKFFCAKVFYNTFHFLCQCSSLKGARLWKSDIQIKRISIAWKWKTKFSNYGTKFEPTKRVLSVESREVAWEVKCSKMTTHLKCASCFYSNHCVSC